MSARNKLAAMVAKHKQAKDEGSDMVIPLGAILASVAVLLIGGCMAEVKKSPWTTTTALIGLIMGIWAITTRAPASEVEAIRVQLDSINVTQLERYLVETRSEQCAATNKRFYTERLNELLTDYFKKTGRNFDLPSCEEVKTS